MGANFGIILVRPMLLLVYISAADLEPDPLGSYHFALSGSKIFILDLDPNPTYYRGIVDGTPTPTRYAYTDELEYVYEILLHLRGKATLTKYIHTRVGRYWNTVRWELVVFYKLKFFISVKCFFLAYFSSH